MPTGRMNAPRCNCRRAAIAALRSCRRGDNSRGAAAGSTANLRLPSWPAGAGVAEFAAVRNAIKTTDGNASVHLRKLEDGGYVAVEKRFVARKPQSLYRLTEA